MLRVGECMQNTRWRGACWRLGAPLLWTMAIGCFSTPVFSIVQTGRFLMPILHSLLPNASPETLGMLHEGIRKGMHLFEFAIFALLWYRTLSRSGAGSQTRLIVAVLLLAVSFASLDEVHQLFEPGRSASMLDVGWDSLGAALALAARRVVWRS